MTLALAQRDAASMKLRPVSKRLHEVRDPVHVFVHFDDDERQVIDSMPFQRLRNVHQLALTYLVYPGASHKRFEHSLGVMELAGRIYDTVMRHDKLTDSIREVVPSQGQNDHGYWRTVVRMAALCHDLGHLPFSHAAEDELLPANVDHERITWDIVHSEEMATILDELVPPIKPDLVGKLALGPRKAEKLGLQMSFTPWEAILAEIIVGDAFGADRMDYLLRDSLHTGATYGRFDHHRLIDTLRIMPSAPREEGDVEASTEPTLGCERGGLQSAEALLLARYFMFSQVYYHPTRLAYNEHLKDFLIAWLPEGHFSADVAEHLSRDDHDILVAIKRAADDPGAPGHLHARRIIRREHFKVAYDRSPEDSSADVRALAAAAAAEFGPDQVRHGASPSRGSAPDFPVYDRNGRSLSALGLSDVFGKLPTSPDEYVLADDSIRKEVEQWLKDERERILEEALEAQAEENDEKEATA
jgi:HD superfamily phosphohydrolase